MKWLAYALSFLTHMLYRVMRVSYAFSKPYFKAQLGVTNLLLGLLDAFTYFAQAFGQGTRYLFFGEKSKMLLYFVAGALLLSGSFALFPVLSMAGFITEENSQFLLIGIMILVGFWSFNIFLSLFAILHDFFNNHENGGAIGFWIASGDIGIALGYLIPSLFIVSAGIQWEVPLLFIAGLFAIFSIVLYLMVSTRSEMQATQGQLHEDQSITFAQFRAFAANELTNPTFLLYISIVCLAKPLFFGLMEWLPTFVHSEGESTYSGEISMVFIVTTVIGSWAIGKFYERETASEQQEALKTKQLYALTIVLLVLISCGFLYICQMEQFSIVDFIIVLCVEGFALGGLINVLVCNEVIKMGNGDSRRTEMLNTLSNVIGNSAVAMVHLIMGVWMGEKESNEDGENPYLGVFYVLLGVSVLLLGLYVFKGVGMCLGWRQSQQTDKQVRIFEELEEQPQTA